MANVQESPLWDAGIYQLETTDPVMGGPNGIDNLQATQLANRTLYLKQKLEEGLNAIDVLLLDKSDSQTITAAVFNEINFNSILSDPAGIVPAGTTESAIWSVPAGYTHARVSGSCTIDPPDGADLLFSVSLSIAGLSTPSLLTGQGGNAATMSAGEYVAGNFISPFIPVQEGDTVGMVVYAQQEAVSVASQCWLQIEFVKA